MSEDRETIEAQHEALESMTGGSSIRVYGLGYRNEIGARRHSVALTDSSREKLAAARAGYDACKKEQVASEIENSGIGK